MVIVCVYLSVSTMTTILLCVSRQERRELEDLFIKAGEIERIRLGTELHDDICQQLAGAGFIASLIRERPDMTARDARSHLDHICSEIQRSIQSMRSLARGLSPLGVDKKQLSVALGDLAALSERIYGIECHFDAAGPLPTLDRETTIHLFRITQEAISNAVKHGRATRVEIVARAVPGCLHLRIGDDGLGLPADAREKDGLGFKTMAYRVALMNGSLSIQDHRQAPGVIVACCIPVLT
jgi:signal transduction histidine kinase